MTERMRQLLLGYAKHIVSDDAIVDEYTGEGMTFDETLELMEHVAIAVEQYARANPAQPSS